MREVVIGAQQVGARLDSVLAEALALSRSRIQGLVESGCVTVGDARLRASDRARLGQRVQVAIPAPTPTELVPEDLPLSILFEDEDLLVIDKAPGMAAHPGAGVASGTVANAVLFHSRRLSISGEVRPGIVHRLDKDTSGAMVIAKNDEALGALQRAFAAREVNKKYLAWCLGTPASPLDLVTGHRRADGDRRRFTTKVRAEGNARLAHTKATIEQSAGGASQWQVELLTGRTHQIRAHFADIGHPLLQDELYGGGQAHKRLAPGPVRDAVAVLKRQALHARTLSLRHPRSGARLTFEAPLPADLLRVRDAMAATGRERA